MNGQGGSYDKSKMALHFAIGCTVTALISHLTPFRGVFALVAGVITSLAGIIVYEDFTHSRGVFKSKTKGSAGPRRGPR